LRRGDVILEADRKPIKSDADFHKVVNAKKTYLLRVRRLDGSGQEMFLVVTLRLAAEKSAEDAEE
jgi:S1-C subfamily serine protease